MSSLIYNSALFDAANGDISFGTDSFYAMLVKASYTPDKKAHTKRSDVVAHEVAASGGYVAGGFASPVTVEEDSDANEINVSLSGISIPGATITARRAVYYKRRGGAATEDELVACIDFGANVTSTNGAWALTDSVLRIQN